MNSEFKIHCLALTKNEADVIALCLKEASKWADYIYVYDGQSTDGTWEIVKSLGNSRIIPWKQDGKVFKEGLRAEIFNEFRHLASPGDWWLQLNVDEFYPEDPRKFFQRVPSAYNFVWGINVEYYLTHKDVEELDFSLPFESIKPAMRHYNVSWSEPRAFRYRPRLVWKTDWAWPRHAGLVARERIIFEHYPYRSPRQIQTRLDVRRDNRARGFEGWEHAKDPEWRSKIVPQADCKVRDASKAFNIDDAKLPRHLEKPCIRVLKRALHTARIWP